MVELGRGNDSGGGDLWKTDISLVAQIANLPVDSPDCTAMIGRKVFLTRIFFHQIGPKMAGTDAQDENSFTQSSRLRYFPAILLALLLFTVAYRSVGITRPLVGNFSTKSVIYGMIARFKEELRELPRSERRPYRTPLRDLWMCGSGTHPGGGIMGAPGELAARAILGAS